MRLNPPPPGGNGGRGSAPAPIVMNGLAAGGRGLRAAARLLRRALAHPAPAIRVSSLLAELATVAPDAALRQLETSFEGLSDAEARLRLLHRRGWI